MIITANINNIYIEVMMQFYLNEISSWLNVSQCRPVQLSRS